jgi:UDP-N-acetylenolpyruvoylglucosamine reductase
MKTASPIMATRKSNSHEHLAQELLNRVTDQTLVRADEPLAKRTTLRVGGPADLYVEPASEEDLKRALNFIQEHDLPLFMLGRGSNLLVKDQGFRGAVICLGQAGFSSIEVSGHKLVCGAAAKLRTVSMEAKRHGLTGLEFLEGIPGTVGGGLRMNAGAMGGAMFDVVESVRVMDYFGKVSERATREIQVEYRKCVTLKEVIALCAVLRVAAGEKAAIEKRMKECSQKRWSSQPSAPSAGCIFKNPASIPAGRLIDELGMKNARVGGAYVSSEHGNFIVNDGTASASDVLELIQKIQDQARTTRQIELETEVEILGE